MNMQSQPEQAHRQQCVELDYPCIERINGIPEFKLLALGTRGAGKTVFLAALYNQLKAQNKSYYILRTDDEKRQHLVATYDIVKGVGQSWPKANIQPVRYKFSAIHQTRSEDIHIFDFNYLDFPGGFIFGDATGGEFDIQDEVGKTHSLVILIDGLSILRKMMNISVEGPDLYDEIDAMIDLINKCVRRPVQVVITKFDILVNCSLVTARNVLIESRRFRNFIDLRREWSLPTHLVGVSAVGNQFADCNPRTGAMRKRKGAQPNPYNLDVILSFAVTDTLLTSLKGRTNTLTIVSKLLGALGVTAGALETALNFANVSTGDISQMFLMAALERASKAAKQGVKKWQDGMQASIAHIKSANEAIDAILSGQQIAIEEYLENNPGCDLLNEPNV